MSKLLNKARTIKRAEQAIDLLIAARRVDAPESTRLRALAEACGLGREFLSAAIELGVEPMPPAQSLIKNELSESDHRTDLLVRTLGTAKQWDFKEFRARVFAEIFKARFESSPPGLMRDQFCNGFDNSFAQLQRHKFCVLRNPRLRWLDVLETLDSKVLDHLPPTSIKITAAGRRRLKEMGDIEDQRRVFAEHVISWVAINLPLPQNSLLRRLALAVKDSNPITEVWNTGLRIDRDQLCSEKFRDLFEPSSTEGALVLSPFGVLVLNAVKRTSLN